MAGILLNEINYSGGGSGASSLTDLSDVNIASPQDGNVLKYNSNTSKWENAAESGGTTVVANPSGTASDDLTKVQIGSTIYDIPTAVANTLAGLSDVSISSPAHTNILMYNTYTNKWYNVEMINDLSTGWSSYSPVSAYAVSEALDEIHGFDIEPRSALDAKVGQVPTRSGTADSYNPYIAFEDLYSLRGTSTGINRGEYFMKVCQYLTFDFLSSQDDSKTVNVSLPSGSTLNGVNFFYPECYLSSNSYTHPIDYCFKDETDPSSVVHLYYRLSYTSAGVITVNVHADSTFGISDDYLVGGRFCFLVYKTQ